MTQPTRLVSLEDVRKRFRDIEVATLTTIDERGTLSSRPMKLQRFDDSGNLWFVANHTAAWVAGSHGAAANVSLQDDHGWVSLAGTLDLLRAPETLDEFHDPNRSRIARSDVAVLRLAPTDVEWWVQPSAREKVIGKLTELLAGDEPPGGTHGRLRL